MSGRREGAESAGVPGRPAGRPIRVLVVDDSAFMRRVITRILESDPALEVVGTARDGLEAVARAAQLQPDVITLDVEMPRLDGLAALPQILAVHRCPVVMVSSLTQQGALATVRALALGAVDFVAKPSGSVSLDLDRVAGELVGKVKAAAAVPPERVGLAAPSAPARPSGRTGLRSPDLAPPPASADPATGDPAQAPAPVPAGGSLVPAGPAPVPRSSPGAGSRRITHLVLVAASTGGPGALYRLLGALPTGLPAAVVIVQHMPPGFTRALAAHLDDASGLTVTEAADGDRLHDGGAWVAPGDYHVRVTPGGVLRLDRSPPRHGVRPAADVTFESVPPELAGRAIAIILTGMGADGARGARYLREHGARVWIQSPASCVVPGMPGAAAALGVVERAGTPEELAAWLVEAVGGPGLPADGRAGG
ncbi:response regulator receiver modulated CheB methylesterase [Thermaerobacter marianensis DSM 12885]|uniref:Protein-glutamate methylesterase/protein-glutamine glutaminase n=1 Tax=Thermaerobacter marianensis (strain ATCC 700841 / DSM 12885 / JCM 10246 / 7p75a) TaxID=644966 RepID=E6SJU7_THEM7|nr:chemotaxis response regulator protein-glutamate methylesterase [Thermaerobacter marianensis]ADU52180.1 response regulator receiver modulated CheB methylesterase [Thermaerobacter marianensis DSM 12885]